MGSNDEIWEDRADRVGGSFTRHPIVWIVAVLVLLGIVGFIVSWIGAAAEVVSPDNVRQQYALAYQDYNALQATAQNACVIRDAVKNATSDDEKTQRESQLLAVQTNYNNIASQYEARMQNIFQAKKVKPTDLPFQAPTESEMESQLC